MTKNILNLRGQLTVYMSVKSDFDGKERISTEEGTSTSSNLRGVYSKNVKPNISRMFKGAKLHALAKHVYRIQKKRAYNYDDYQDLIRGEVKRYQMNDWNIEYFGVDIKRKNINHKYYNIAYDKKTGKQVNKVRWKNKKYDDSEDDFFEENE